jgi:intracellular multiplication protein IcmK
VEASLDPGATFPVIHLVPGIATTVTVVDSTGAPWPIADLVVGNMKSFPVRRLSTPNGVVIEPKNDVGWTNLAIALKGRGTPAVLRLVDSERTSDTRVTVRIAARGPLARPALFSEESPHVSAELLSYLDGIPPRSAIPLYVRGAEDTEAWTDKNKMIVRTHKDVIAPAWLETVTGTGGMKVYVFPPVTAITLAGDDGIMKTVELEEAADGKR